MLYPTMKAEWVYETLCALTKKERVLNNIKYTPVTAEFLSVFAKLRKVIVGFFMSVCLGTT